MYLKYEPFLIFFLEKIVCYLVWPVTLKCPHGLSGIVCQGSDVEKSKIKVQLVLVKSSSLFVHSFLFIVSPYTYAEDRH